MDILFIVDAGTV